MDSNFNETLDLLEPIEQSKNEIICNDIIILPAKDIFDTLASVTDEVQATILDPWYNKGLGGVQSDYHQWLKRVLDKTAEISQHIFLWGFPEIVCKSLDYLPRNYHLVAWLTWYYKNCPSVIRGWRSAQFACLHLARTDAKLYPEHFLNDVQKERHQNGKLRFIPGPPSVIEYPLIIGFVGKQEQTGHPAQKPEKVIEPLILMSTKQNDLVLDPMCGSGTTGAVCKKLNRRAILGDMSEKWTNITQERVMGYINEENICRSN